MAERLRAFPNRLAEAIVRGLQTIGVDDASQWLTRPLTVARFRGAVDFNLPKPMLLVKIGAVIPEPGIGRDYWDDQVEILIACIAEDADDPDGALHDLVADVRRWLRENFRGVEGLVPRGMWERGFTPEIEQVAGRAGIGMGIVRAEANCRTSESNP